MSFDPSESPGEIEWEIPESYSITSEVESHAEAFGDRVALRFLSETGQSEERSYGEIRDDADRFAGYLESVGVEEGDRVMELFPRHPDVFSVQLGVLATGALIVPVSPVMEPEDIEVRAKDCGADTVVVHESLKELIDPVLDETGITESVVIGEGDDHPSLRGLVGNRPTGYSGPELGAGDPMAITYTSGTTGEPKPVVHKHRWIYVLKRVNAPYWWGIEPGEGLDGELLWATTGTGWAKWFWSPVGVGLTTGATQLIYEGDFEPETVLDILEDEGVTRFCSVPAEYRTLAENADLSSYDLEVTDFLSAGEPLNVETIDQIEEAFDVTPRSGYGQTETVALVANYPGLDVKPGSMGKPLPGTGTTLIDFDEEREIREPGKLGEIAVPVDSPVVTEEYYNKPYLREEKLVGEFYRTGDIATFDYEGYFFFKGRADDIIISGDSRISPFEVEDGLVSHGGVVEAAAVASPHDDLGTAVKAFVLPAEGAESGEEMKEELRERVAEETDIDGALRQVEFVDDLPKTSSGKIRRHELRRQEMRDLEVSSARSELTRLANKNRLLERKEQLRQEKEVMEEFARIVSHDLRNPLNVAKGRLELAMEEGDDEHLEEVACALQRMNDLIDDMLDLARSGDNVSDMERVHLASLVEESWQNVDTEEAGLEVDVGGCLEADRSRFKQMVENLMRNAVEHGGPGVTLSVGELDDGFYLEDGGPGIPECDQGRVFDEGFSSAEEGTGLGLTIVRQIAEAHGWDVRVSEGEEGGARFEFAGVELS